MTKQPKPNGNARGRAVWISNDDDALLQSLRALIEANTRVAVTQSATIRAALRALEREQSK